MEYISYGLNIYTHSYPKVNPSADFISLVNKRIYCNNYGFTNLFLSTHNNDHDQVRKEADETDEEEGDSRADVAFMRHQEARHGGHQHGVIGHLSCNTEKVDFSD